MASKDKLDSSFLKSLKHDSSELISEYTEIGLDELLAKAYELTGTEFLDFCRKVPFVKTAITIYDIVASVRGRATLTKTMKFVLTINDGIVDEKERQKILTAVQKNPKDRNKELEYILVMLDYYTQDEKAKMLACLYLKYLKSSESFHPLKWPVFIKYSEVINRLLPYDVHYLVRRFHDMDEKTRNEIMEVKTFDDENFRMRMASLGLLKQMPLRFRFVKVYDFYGKPADIVNVIREDLDLRDYEVTEFGRYFINVMNEYYDILKE